MYRISREALLKSISQFITSMIFMLAWRLRQAFDLAKARVLYECTGGVLNGMNGCTVAGTATTLTIQMHVEALPTAHEASHVSIVFLSVSLTIVSKGGFGNGEHWTKTGSQAKRVVRMCYNTVERRQLKAGRRI